MEQRRVTDYAVREARVRNRVMAVTSAVTLVLTLGLMATLAYWQFYPYKTITKEPLPMAIVKGYETVRQGDWVVYEYNYEKYTDVIPKVSRQFVDGLIFESTDMSTHVNKGSGHVHVAVPIPMTLPPGRYRIRVNIEYQMNPIRTISNADETCDFTVISATDCPNESKDSTVTK
jgi:hypothetical protein